MVRVRREERVQGSTKPYTMKHSQAQKALNEWQKVPFELGYPGKWHNCFVNLDILSDQQKAC